MINNVHLTVSRDPGQQEENIASPAHEIRVARTWARDLQPSVQSQPSEAEANAAVRAATDPAAGVVAAAAGVVVAAGGAAA